MFRRRLKSLISPKPPEREAEGAVALKARSQGERSIAAADNPLGEPGMPTGGRIPFSNPALLAEAEANAAIAKAPWKGKPSAFDTAVWDRGGSAVGSLRKDIRDQLSEAYIDIELANRLVWISEVGGRVTTETQANYTKLCARISERLDLVTSLAGRGGRVTQKSENAVGGEIVPVQDSSKIEERGNVAETDTSSEDTEEHEELFLGATTILIARGAKGSQVAGLTRLVSETPDVRVISSGGSQRGPSYVSVSVNRPFPLLKLLRSLPMVRTAYRQGTGIEVVFVSE
jgi:hypothetical protein